MSRKKSAAQPVAAAEQRTNTRSLTYLPPKNIYHPISLVYSHIIIRSCRAALVPVHPSLVFYQELPLTTTPG